MYFQLEVVNSVIKLREWANTLSAAWQLRSWRGRSGPGPSPWRHPPDGCRDGRHGRGRLDHQGDQRGAVPVPARILRLLMSRVRRRILEVCTKEGVFLSRHAEDFWSSGLNQLLGSKCDPTPIQKFNVRPGHVPPRQELWYFCTGECNFQWGNMSPLNPKKFR